MLRQRQPVLRDPKHLEFIRDQPCCICGGPSEAAHIRSGNLGWGKLPCGMQERDDRWVTPLCSTHHREQHTMNEMAFWHKYKKDPFVISMLLRRK
jgi:hypothetical protein